jgi:hypothetical protein
MENKKSDEQEKSFVIRDKRFSAKKEEETPQAKPEAKKQETPPPESEPEQTAELPEISFANLILSLSTSALIQLGEIQDPMTQKNEKNLPLAKQTVDLISLLQEKTKGNLTPDEEKLMENVLYDLRMRYVKATR